METNQPTTDQLRPAQNAADANTLLRMMETFCQHFNYPFDRAQRWDLIWQMLDTPSLGSLWLIDHDRQPVGYVVLTYGFALEFGGKTALVDELFIEEAHRGVGRGGRVLRGIQQLTDQIGVSVVLLQTEKYNVRAKRLYESLGFVDQERSTLMWKK
ncbi:GNAT family N-acetyltransferase [Larkinella bovis]|uniref:GNAT family N-acetyltransferase n=1 Tax=Larkinella bovis TaxID=683041 RepID=A0ABW0IFK0_9BACT